MDGLIGEIRAFAGNFAPVNWMFCNGSLLPIADPDYQALFSLIGTCYGGDGRTSFALPDLRGRMTVGTGQGPDLTYRRLGEASGATDVFLTIQTMPEHSHLVKTSSADSCNLEAPTSNAAPGRLESSDGSAFGYLKGSDSSLKTKDLNEETVQKSGNGYSHNNIMPCIAINYIICYRGTYPQRK